MSSDGNRRRTAPSGDSAAVAYPSPAPPPRVNAETLLAGGRELVIIHQQEEYHLRITKKGRLLLTK
jgi:hemin uptake protein HemP